MASVIKREQIKSVSASIETRDLDVMSAKRNNLYEAIVIIGKRADQLGLKIREELHAKLEEFAPTSDNLEEVFENREQIEISKYYERMPSATLIATQEFLDDALYVRDPNVENEAA